MIVLEDISAFESDSPVFLTQGTFDGVHLGHQKILKKLVADAQAANGVSVLLTFFPHPRLVLYPDDNELKMLNTLDEKIHKVERMGLDYLIILPFTKELSRTTAEMFTRDVLVNKLDVSKLIIGYDHRFGKNREGSLEQMRAFSEIYDFEVEEIPAQDVDDSIISSTKIRRALLAGDVKTANASLGESYQLTGTVVRGNQRGRVLGYPTANIDLDANYKLIPSFGVYGVRVTYAGTQYYGMLNIGYNPTFENTERRIEVHIFDFDLEIYQEEITLELDYYVREEHKFSGPEELKQQLKLDEQEVRGLYHI